MSTLPSELANLAEWLDDPLTPGKQRELNNWLSEDPDNQVVWGRWMTINAGAKRLQVVPTDVTTEWTKLRDDLGFERGKRMKRRSKAGRKQSLLRRPGVVAVASMVVYSLFLAFLWFLRTTMGH